MSTVSFQQKPFQMNLVDITSFSDLKSYVSIYSFIKDFRFCFSIDLSFYKFRVTTIEHGLDKKQFHLSNLISLNIILQTKNYIGKRVVTKLEDALSDMKTTSTHLQAGVSILLRVKNEKSNIQLCIESVYSLVDEVIVVDNMSDDGTLEILQILEKKYQNLLLYQYNINVPKAGQEHKNRIKINKDDSLATFYNWTLSKANYNTVIKWDGDFICIQKNFQDMLDTFHLRNRTDRFALWFSGITCFHKKYYNLVSYYDEFRAFSKLNGFRWESCVHAESSGFYSYDNETSQLHYGTGEISYGQFENDCTKLSYFISYKPVFIEMKNNNDLKIEECILDIRDTRDNSFIIKYASDESKETEVITMNSFQFVFYKICDLTNLSITLLLVTLSNQGFLVHHSHTYENLNVFLMSESQKQKYIIVHEYDLEALRLNVSLHEARVFVLRRCSFSKSDASDAQNNLELYDTRHMRATSLVKSAQEHFLTYKQRILNFCLYESNIFFVVD
jgi:glycosyltransferase involved in cell wall biosynthesis